MDASDDGVIARRRQRTQSPEFKGQGGVGLPPSGCIDGRRGFGERPQCEPGAPLGCDGGLGTSGEAAETAAPVAAAVEQRTFIPIEVEHPRMAATQAITIELRRGATVVKVDWPLATAAECAAWLRELLR
jgi:hypothetical protein